MSTAYPNIDMWQRKFVLTKNGIEITDTVKAPKPVEVTYPLHFLSEPFEEDGVLTLERKGRKLNVEVAEGELTLKEITDKYDVDLNEGEPEEYHVTRPVQYHAYYKTEAKREHVIKVKYTLE